MVRTYQANDYKLVSPWEQAMQNADTEQGKPVATGKRMYNNVNVSQRSTDEQRVLRLPPISNNPGDLHQFLGEEIGKILVRSKEKITKISKEFILYDPMECGMMSKSAACEILKTYRLPPNENFQKQLANMFTVEHEQGKINHKLMIEFFENSRSAALERNEADKQQQQQQQQQHNTQVKLTDSYTGRYDSTPSKKSSDNQHMVNARRGEAVRQAFAERRDAGLLLEIERAMLTYNGADPVELIDQLEDSLRSSCRNDEGLVPNLHVKSTVGKLQFPINTALTLKCIERLDPFDNGKIEYIKFIEFFRRAIRASPRSHPSHRSTSYKPETVPEKPAWENRKPLHSIQHSEQRQESYETKRSELPKQQNGHHHYEENSHRDNISENSYDDPYQNYLERSYTLPEKQEVGRKYDRADSDDPYLELLSKSYLATEHNDRPNIMDDDIESAFAHNLEKLKSERNRSNQNNHTNYPDKNMDTSDFGVMGHRGEAYKRVADALQDKAKFSEGIISNQEVRQIVNYYNLLFDTNIPVEQVDYVLNKHSANNQIEVNYVINEFGKDIV